jgi:menaquinone-dependent protoporphyrinogen oxidase
MPIKIVLIAVGLLVVCGAIFGFIMYSAINGGKAGIKMADESFGKKGKKVLLAYASKAGSTSDAAVIIGKALAEQGAIVDVKPAGSVKDVSGYDAFVIGTAIRAGKPVGDFTSFISKNRSILNAKPAAIFLVCMTLSKDTPETRKEVEKYFASAKKLITPKAEGYFAGRMDYSKLTPMTKYIVKNMVKVPEGDFMNEAELKAWAKEIFSKLK